MLIGGLLDTYEVCFEESLLEFAEKLQKTQDRLFWDKEHSGYYTTAPGNESEIVLRLKEGQHLILFYPVSQAKIILCSMSMANMV